MARKRIQPAEVPPAPPAAPVVQTPQAPLTGPPVPDRGLPPTARPGFNPAEIGAGADAAASRGTPPTRQDLTGNSAQLNRAANQVSVSPPRGPATPMDRPGVGGSVAPMPPGAAGTSARPTPYVAPAPPSPSPAPQGPFTLTGPLRGANDARTPFPGNPAMEQANRFMPKAPMTSDQITSRMTGFQRPIPLSEPAPAGPSATPPGGFPLARPGAIPLASPAPGTPTPGSYPLAQPPAPPPPPAPARPALPGPPANQGQLPNNPSPPRINVQTGPPLPPPYTPPVTGSQVNSALFPPPPPPAAMPVSGAQVNSALFPPPAPAPPPATPPPASPFANRRPVIGPGRSGAAPTAAQLRAPTPTPPLSSQVRSAAGSVGGVAKSGVGAARAGIGAADQMAGNLVAGAPKAIAKVGPGIGLAALAHPEGTAYALGHPGEVIPGMANEIGATAKSLWNQPFSEATADHLNNFNPVMAGAMAGRNLGNAAVSVLQGTAGQDWSNFKGRLSDAYNAGAPAAPAVPNPNPSGLSPEMLAQVQRAGGNPANYLMGANGSLMATTGPKQPEGPQSPQPQAPQTADELNAMYDKAAGIKPGAKGAIPPAPAAPNNAVVGTPGPKASPAAPSFAAPAAPQPALWQAGQAPSANPTEAPGFLAATMLADRQHADQAAARTARDGPYRNATETPYNGVGGPHQVQGQAQVADDKARDAARLDLYKQYHGGWSPGEFRQFQGGGIPVHRGGTSVIHEGPGANAQTRRSDAEGNLFRQGTPGQYQEQIALGQQDKHLAIQERAAESQAALNAAHAEAFRKQGMTLGDQIAGLPKDRQGLMQYGVANRLQGPALHSFVESMLRAGGKPAATGADINPGNVEHEFANNPTLSHLAPMFAPDSKVPLQQILDHAESLQGVGGLDPNSPVGGAIRAGLMKRFPGEQMMGEMQGLGLYNDPSNGLLMRTLGNNLATRTLTRVAGLANNLPGRQDPAEWQGLDSFERYGAGQKYRQLMARLGFTLK